MEDVFYKRVKLKIYTSMDEIPIMRFQAFNHGVLLESNIGGDLDSMIKHINGIDKYVALGKNDEARVMLANMRQNVMFIVNRVSPKMAAFAALTHSVNGRPNNDLTTEGVKAFTKEMSGQGMTINIVNEAYDKIRKKLSKEFAIYFPKRAASVESMELYGRLRRASSLKLKDIINGTDSRDELQKIEDFLMDLFKPELMWGAKGAEVRFINTFDTVAGIVGQHVNTPIKSMTAREFYNTLDLLQEQFKKNPK